MKPKHMISIKSKTGLNELNSLFDNGPAMFLDSQINARESFLIKRNKEGKCYFSTKSSGDDVALISVIGIDNNYYIDNGVNKALTNSVTDILNANWIPIRYAAQYSQFKNYHKLLEGDVIKVGRLVFQVSNSYVLYTWIDKELNKSK